jgi:hypothetical protein
MAERAESAPDCPSVPPGRTGSVTAKSPIINASLLPLHTHDLERHNKNTMLLLALKVKVTLHKKKCKKKDMHEGG